ALDRQFLDLKEHRLALLEVALEHLLLKKRVNVGIAPIGIGSLGVDEAIHAARCIARVANSSHEQPAQLLLLPSGVKGRTLHRPQSHADADRTEIVDDRLRHGGKPRDRCEFPGIDPAWIASFRPQLCGLMRGVRGWLALQREVQGAGDDNARRWTEAEACRLIDARAIECQVYSQPEPLVVPG